jgi:Undecaprenyl-phosphate galactose phosphotransferase WbaP
MLKRALDLFGASLLLLMCLPLLGVIALVLRMEGGPVLYAQWRIGRHGRPFRCWKFRTMLPDAEAQLAELLAQNTVAREEWARDQKLRDDPRVTRIGQVLRRTSLDELPQLWNILRGEMSLVGPRPMLEDQQARYGAALATCLSVRPGLTGLWQVSGRNRTTFAERVELDLAYVRQQSLALDLWILWRTVFVVLSQRGAY